MRIFLLAALLLLPQLSAAQIYKSTDEQGNVSFSDTPSKTSPSEQVELQQTNASAPPPEVAPLNNGNSDKATDEEAGQGYSVSIAAPADETTIAMGPGNFSVSASVEPPLAGGSLLQLYVDGTASGTPQSSTSWDLTNVFRGAHDLSVAIVDRKGDQLAKSDSVRVYVLRPSVNFKNRN